jgi:hypothetical protein
LPIKIGFQKTLLTFAAVGGTIGAALAMYLFRHKTSKLSFLNFTDRNPTNYSIGLFFFMKNCFNKDKTVQAIFFTLFWCRPPSNAVFINVSPSLRLWNRSIPRWNTNDISIIVLTR